MLLNQMEACLIRPIFPAGLYGGIFTGIDILRGLPKEHAPKIFARNFGVIYAYNVLQCPMEAIHGRKSLIHNFMAGGILGYTAVVKNIAGIPFVDSSFFIRYPQMTPPIMGALVYGAMGGAFGALSGKPW